MGFSLVSENRAALVAAHGLFTAVTPPAAGHRFSGPHASVVAVLGLGSRGSWALEHGLSSCGHRLSCSEARGIFLDQESNLCLLHWKVDSLPLSRQGSPLLVSL